MLTRIGTKISTQLGFFASARSDGGKCGTPPNSRAFCSRIVFVLAIIGFFVNGIWGATLTGTVRMSGDVCITDFTDGDLHVLVEDWDTRQVYFDAVTPWISFDDLGCIFEISGLPDVDLRVFFEVDGSNPRLPNPGEFWAGLKIDAGFDGQGGRVAISENLHLLEPFDNSETVNLWDPDPEYSSPVLFRWAPATEASFYEVVIRCGGQTVIDQEVQGTSVTLDLPQGQTCVLYLQAFTDTMWTGETWTVYGYANPGDPLEPTDYDPGFYFGVAGTATSPPNADFWWNTNSPTAGESVAFTDSSSGSPTSWNWDFGDGGTSTSRNPDHTYSAANTYTVILTASNSGGSDTATKQITVSAAGSAPDASFEWFPIPPDAGEQVQFTDTSTGSPTSWSWTFGDGDSSSQQNPTHTFDAAGSYSVKLTASNQYGSDSKTRTVTMEEAAVGNTITVGGLTFVADSISQKDDKYTLTGAVAINDTVTYNGTLEVSGPNNQGYYTMGGTGKLAIPTITGPGGGPLVLYNGTFGVKFKNGGIHDFLEDHTKLTLAGWAVRIEKLTLVPGGVQVKGSLAIPQYGPGLGKIYAAATVQASDGSGVELVSGDLKVEKIGLSSGFSLEKIVVTYHRPTNTFKGGGELKTAAMGLKVGVEVIEGALNGATVTITGVPVVLGNTGLQLVDYGVDATGLSGRDPFGIGIHTDMTLVGNPDPDLLSFADMNVMYFPLDTLTGGGKVRVLKAELAEAEFFVNDGANDCAGGVCVQGEIGLPTLDNAFLYGELYSDLMTNPFSMGGTGRMALQIPKNCTALDLKWYEKATYCPIIATVCLGDYPCVIAELRITFSLEPGADPEAALIGEATVLGHSWFATVAYNEGGDEDFHLHFGDDNNTKALRVNTKASSSESSQVIPQGTRDAYLAVRGSDGVMPKFTIVDPDGIEYTSSGGDGVDYFEDRDYLAAVYALVNPKPGRWTLITQNGNKSTGLTQKAAGVQFASSIVDQPATVSIDDVRVSSSGYRIDWTGIDPEGTATVDLVYAAAFDGPNVGIIADDLLATGELEKKTWDISEVPAGDYWVRARIADPSGTSTYTWNEPVSVEPPDAPNPPTSLQRTKVSRGVVDLSWDASPSPSVTGYVVAVRSGAGAQAVEHAVGETSSFRLSGLEPTLGHEAWVAAHDAESQRSGPSNTVSVAWESCELVCSAQAPSTAGVGDVVTFTSQLTASGCAGEVHSSWEFGDATGSNEHSASHVYTATGTFPWTYSAEVGNESCSAAGTIRINELGCAITVTSPTSGDELASEESATVRWQAEGSCGGNFRVDLYSGSSAIQTLNENADGLRAVWTPSSEMADEEVYRIRVSVRDNPTYAAFSAPFLISSSGPTGPSISSLGEFAYVVPGSAHTAGIGGTNWVSDLVLFNPGDQQATAYVYFLESEQNNSKTKGKKVTISAGATRGLDDVVYETFGLSKASGALVVGSDNQLVVTSRTYTGSNIGTFGQFVAGFPKIEAISRNQEARLIQLTQNTDFRTNIGFANATGMWTDVMVEVFRASGIFEKRKTIRLMPFGFLQRTKLFGADKDGYAIVSSATPGAKYFTYATVVDNRTGDPIYIPPVSAVDASVNDIYIPAAARVSGIGGTNWRTDIEIHNPGNGPVVLEYYFLPKGGGESLFIDGELWPQKSTRVEDVLLENFGLTSAAGAIRISSSGEIIVTSRTYNDTPKGTYGQFAPGYSVESAVTTGQNAYLSQLSRSASTSSGFRTNIGFVNATNRSINIRVHLYESSGSLLGTKKYSLTSYEFNQVTDIFGKVTSGNVENGYAVVTSTTPNAKFFTYATVVDNRSGDPVFVPPTVMEGSGGGGTGGNPEEMTVMLPGGVPLELVKIPAGTFMMGSPADEIGHSYNEDLHQVSLTKDYYMGKYEVTQEQWKAVMGGNPAESRYGRGDNYPAYYVTWNSVGGQNGFIEKLNDHLGTTKFRLPTEAEWERAARAGTATPFSFGDVGSCVGKECSGCSLHHKYMVWFCTNEGSHAEEVGSKLPNAYGLHDMHGNVWEFVADGYKQHLGTDPKSDPLEPVSGSEITLRGGYWANYSEHCRSAVREEGSRSERYSSVGFRIARSE